MEIEYSIVIPSYKREKIIKKKTLAMLRRANVSTDKITIFVASEEEKQKYEEQNPGYKIVVGRLGIREQRNFIVQYLREGTNALFIDDDVVEIQRLVDEKLIRVEDLNSFFKEGFSKAMDNNSYLWGVYPARNAFYMMKRPEYERGLSFILGTFYGQIIRHGFTLNVEEKEDVENSIMHFINDGGVFRFNKLTLKTRFHAVKGGLGAMNEERKQRHRIAAEYLEEVYSQYGFIKRRKTGRWEFVLKLKGLKNKN